VLQGNTGPDLQEHSERDVV